jgi:hypothetical protein
MTMRWALYSTFAAKYREDQPICASSPLEPVKSSVIAVLHIQASIFNWTYLRCYSRYVDNSTLVTHYICCQMDCSASGLCYVNCGGPSQIQRKYCIADSFLNIQINVYPLLLVICRHVGARYTPKLLPHRARILLYALCQLWSQSHPIYLQFFLCRLQYSIERISAAIGGLSTNLWALYSTYTPITGHICPFALCQLWSLSNTVQLQICIFRLK